MASRSWDSMQLEEQAPPNLLPPITPPEPPHLMDPSREVIDQVVGLGARSGAGNLLESRRLRLPCAVCLWRGPWLHPDPPAAAAVDAVATVKPVAPPVAPRAAPAGAYEGALGEAHVAPAAVTGRTCGDGPPRLCQQGWHSRLGLALAAAAEAGGGAGESGGQWDQGKAWPSASALARGPGKGLGVGVGGEELKSRVDGTPGLKDGSSCYCPRGCAGISLSEVVG
eukprot:scaffold267045_cov19-Tisochrysis_lutea.AAC.1